MNRLQNETSPYLRQHADNPVDWWPWNEEALAEAKATDKPILLSVGYSACHWCHVMAHESFENPEIAEVMNAGFINIKVDREERPDIDTIYMDAVNALTGRGGWPMTVFCFPDGRPFHAGTYWPDKPRGGMPSFPQVLEQVQLVWRDNRGDLEEHANQLLPYVGRQASALPGGRPEGNAIEDASRKLLAAHDNEWGGFGSAPKFPHSMSIDILLRQLQKTNDPEILQTVTTSLDAMASGGIYDHLDGGFSRYSVDNYWLVPHFEKMLYDNALLARAYLHAWQITKEQRWRNVAEETIDYVLRRLIQPGGGFASAEDADSEGVEGLYYVWTVDQINEICGLNSPAVLDWYGVTEQGNFEGANILYRPVRGDLLRPPEIEQARQDLLNVREGRIRPGLDDKVLTEWNGLMLTTLAEAAVAFERTDWLDAAEQNAEFLCETLQLEDGRWLRSWQIEGGARQLGFAADHAAMIEALVKLSEATGKTKWLDAAIKTADVLIEKFSDDDNGGFFTTGNDTPALISRPKEIMDNAVPSANSLAALGLLRLGALTGETKYVEAAEKTINLLGSIASEHPTAFGHLLGAIDFSLSGMTEVVVTGNRPDLVQAVQSMWRPNLVLAWGEERQGPLWEGRDENLAYVCHNFACQAPTDSPEELLTQLQNL